MSTSSLPLPNDQDNQQDSASNKKTSIKKINPRDYVDVKWEVVALTSGLLQAQIIAGRLQNEGIPTRAWQEGAGQALGITIGLLGTGHVMVPEEFVDQALDILESEDSEDVEEEIGD